MIFKKSFILASLLLSTHVFSADNINKTVKNTNTNELQHRFYVTLGSANLDKTKTALEGIGNSATYIRLGWEGKKELESNNIILAAGMSGLLYSDKAKFTQEVTGGWKKGVHTAKSNAESYGLYAELGSYYHVNDNVDLGLFGGYEFALSSKRKIANCKNCYSEKINIDPGAYIVPKVKFLINDSWNLSLSYHQYISGDIKNIFALSIGTDF
jgi:hypothetical protein